MVCAKKKKHPRQKNGLFLIILFLFCYNREKEIVVFSYRQTFCSIEWNINLYRLICDHLSHITLMFAVLKTYIRHSGSKSKDRSSNASSSRYVIKRTHHTAHSTTRQTIAYKWRIWMKGRNGKWMVNKETNGSENKDEHGTYKDWTN